MAHLEEFKYNILFTPPISHKKKALDLYTSPYMQTDLFISTFPNYRMAGRSHQRQQAYTPISLMHCYFYDGYVRAVSLLTSLILCASVRDLLALLSV